MLGSNNGRKKGRMRDFLTALWPILYAEPHVGTIAGVDLHRNTPIDMRLPHSGSDNISSIPDNRFQTAAVRRVSTYAGTYETCLA